MSFAEAIRLALSQIRVQKLKSFFTAIGVMIGVMFLIAVVSIVNGMGDYLENDLVGKLIAKDSFELRSRPNIQMGDVDEAERRSWRSRPRITSDDLMPVLEVLSPETQWALLSAGRGRAESPYASGRDVTINAIKGSWFDIKSMSVSAGRLMTEQEYTLGTPVVVIGEDVKEHFFPNLDPIGRELRVGRIPYSVIGVAEKQGSAFGMSLDQFIVVPYESPAKRLLNRNKDVSGIIIQSPNEQAMQASMEEVREVMRVRHKLRPAQRDDFTMQTSDSALEFWKKIEGFLIWAGIALPSVGLLVGSIVIMNIMLVAVAERTREIGIRKALGARRIDILRQFLVESATLAVLGAIMGILGGAALAKVISSASPLPTSVALWSVVVGVLVGGGVGIISGVYPATRAARLDPIAALRQE